MMLRMPCGVPPFNYIGLLLVLISRSHDRQTDKQSNIQRIPQWQSKIPMYTFKISWCCLILSFLSLRSVRAFSCSVANSCVMSCTCCCVLLFVVVSVFISYSYFVFSSNITVILRGGKYLCIVHVNRWYLLS